MFSRSKKSSQATPPRSDAGSHGAYSGNGDQQGGSSKVSHRDTPKSTPRETPHSTPRGVTAEEYRRLRELLESKCDEVDDLGNNLKLAKDSLR